MSIGGDHSKKIKYVWILLYPLVNIQRTMENHHVFMDKSTISMAMFYVANC